MMQRARLLGILSKWNNIPAPADNIQDNEILLCPILQSFQDNICKIVIAKVMVSAKVNNMERKYRTF